MSWLGGGLHCLSAFLVGIVIDCIENDFIH